MLEAVVWGLIQGVTEFLPVSSDGHLVLVPAFLQLQGPDLATTAVLHLGTLVAILAYFRHDLWRLFHERADPEVRHLWRLLLVGSLPVALAILVIDQVEALQQSVTATAVFLLVNGAVMLIADRAVRRGRAMREARATDALAIGFGQLLAVLPGISRSGLTIATGLVRGFDRLEAARFSFLLGIPAITVAGLLELWTLAHEGGVPGAAWLGVVVAALTGYLAIAFLLRMLARTGLTVYALYCLVVGTLALLVT